MQASPRTLAIRHTGIVVSDMACSLRFYRDLLGMEIWADFTDDSPYVRSITQAEGADIWMVKLKAADGGSIELLQYRSHPRSVPPLRQSYDVGINHLAIQVNDLDGLYETLLSAGVDFHSRPLLSGDGNAKVTYCRDPEGVIVELVEILETSSERGRGVNKHPKG